MKPESEELVLKGDRFDVHRMTIAGRDGKRYQRDVVRHPGAVVLLPLLDPDTVVLIENGRPTIGETLLELPAGTRDPGESPDVTAKRELMEETGYQAGTIRCLHQFYSAPGISDELMHLYLATELVAGPPAREAVESIENRPCSRAEILELLRTHQIKDGKTLVGLYAFLHGFSPDDQP